MPFILVRSFVGRITTDSDPADTRLAENSGPYIREGPEPTLTGPLRRSGSDVPWQHIRPGGQDGEDQGHQQDGDADRGQWPPSDRDVGVGLPSGPGAGQIHLITVSG